MPQAWRSAGYQKILLLTLLQVKIWKKDNCKFANKTFNNSQFNYFGEFGGLAEFSF